MAVRHGERREALLAQPVVADHLHSGCSCRRSWGVAGAATWPAAIAPLSAAVLAVLGVSLLASSLRRLAAP
jgi:hypothetical protein